VEKTEKMALAQAHGIFIIVVQTPGAFEKSRHIPAPPNP
jgi:hypothetical protein